MRARALAFAPIAAVALFVGCSLGLDESKIGAVTVDDGGTLPVADTSAPPQETGARDTSVADAIAIDAGPGCNVDGDCTAPNGCLTPRCDTARHTCVYDLCKQSQACSRAVCDTSTHTCGAAGAVTYHPASFKVTAGPIGCGSNVGKCIAASSTFLFVGTTNGVVAFGVADPSNAAPAPITVSGLPFVPSAIVANGARVFFLGAVVGGGNVQIAWVDTPVDPLATAIAAHTVLVSSPLTSVSDLFAALPSAGIFVQQSDAAKLFPTGAVAAPIADLSALAVFPNTGLPANAVPVAASGGRLVFYRWSQSGAVFSEFFTVVTEAGTATAKAGAETNLSADVGEVWGTPATVQFAEGQSGGLAWGVPTVQIGVQPVGTKTARVAWVLADYNATTPTGTAHVDLETYDPSSAPVGTAVTGPLAWVDATSVLALAQAPADLTMTSVQVAQNGAAGPTVIANRRVVLPISTDKTGATSANGYAFVVAADAADSATVYVFAPNCP